MVTRRILRNGYGRKKKPRRNGICQDRNNFCSYIKKNFICALRKAYNIMICVYYVTWHIQRQTNGRFWLQVGWFWYSRTDANNKPTCTSIIIFDTTNRKAKVSPRSSSPKQDRNIVGARSERRCKSGLKYARAWYVYLCIYIYTRTRTRGYLSRGGLRARQPPVE